MAIHLIDKIKPKNNGTFAMVDAHDVELESGERLEAFLKALAENAGEPDIDYEAHVAFDTAEIVVGVTEDTDDTETTPAILGVAILGRTILGKY